MTFIQIEDPHSDDSAFSQLVRENLEQWEADLNERMLDACETG